jgi:hypothetical protein
VKDAPKSLIEFAEENPRYSHSEAWIITIPEWPEILEAWQSGKVDQRQIRDWLIAIGYEPQQATRAKIAQLSKFYPRRPRG